MSEWTARIRGHRVWGLMEALGPTIDKAVRLDDIDPAAVEALERLRSALAFCGKRLGGSDPLTIPSAPLDSLAGYLEAEQSEIDTFIGDRNAAHLTNANNSADAALLQLAQIPGISTPEELIGLVNAAASHRAELEELTRSSAESRKRAKAEIDELTNKLEVFQVQSKATITDLTAQLDTEKQKIASLSAEQQKLFTDAQESRANTYNETLVKIQDNLAKTVSDQQGQFSAAQESRSRDFTMSQTEAQKRFGDLIADYTKKLTEQDAEFTKQREELTRKSEEDLAGLNAQYAQKADKILEAMEQEKNRIEKLVGVIGNLGVTSGYLNTANQARRLMWLWQGLTVGALVMLSYLAFRTLPLLEDSKGQFKWGEFAGRVLLLASLGVIAAYAGSQADKLFDAEKRNRKLALELEAIGPYLAPLPEEERNKFRILIGDRSFGRDEESAVKARSPATLLDILKSKESKEAVELLIEYAKKLK